MVVHLKIKKKNRKIQKKLFDSDGEIALSILIDFGLSEFKYRSVPSIEVEE
jgi:hypothetical protein